MRPKLRVFFLALVPGILAAQSREPADLERILQRLDVLERQNRELMSEIRSLREQIASGAASPATAAAPAVTAAPTTPPVAERVDVAEQRIHDLAQDRVQSARHSAVQLTGMVLFNSYGNGRYGGGDQYPTTAAPEAAPRGDGATFRQTIVGLKFQAPEHVAGAEVSGDAYFDLFGGSGSALDQLVRLRIASVNFQWANTTFTVAQDKPILAPREPDSLAQVWISPLTDAGNLWLWRPQARIERRFLFGDSAGLQAQAGVLETSEPGNVATAATEYSPSISSGRPAIEGRFAFWKRSAANGNFEIAPGFHVSNSQVAGFSVPSRIVSLDWRIPLARAFTLTGAAFAGENVGVIGGLRQGVVVPYYGAPKAVRSAGGWAQLEYRTTRRLSFHLFGGQEDDRNRDIETGLISKNQSYGINAMYQIVSNVVGSFESSIVQTAYIGSPTRLNPHYDLAFAYLF